MFADAGVTVSANPGYGANAEMLNIDTGPVTITGAGPSVSVFQMPLAHAQSIVDGSQFRHCLEIGSGGAASHVTVSGIACNESGGDGVMQVKQEYYIGLTIDRGARCVRCILSAEGGMDIELAAGDAGENRELSASTAFHKRNNSKYRRRWWTFLVMLSSPMPPQRQLGR